MAKKDLNLTPEELHKQIVTAAMNLKMHKEKNTNLVKNLRRQLAKVLTHANENA